MSFSIVTFRLGLENADLSIASRSLVIRMTGISSSSSLSRARAKSAMTPLLIVIFSPHLALTMVTT